MDIEAKNLVGRPKQGITKQVSLTLTPDEWSTIKNSGGTVAAFIKNLMNPAPEVFTPNPSQHIDSTSELKKYPGGMLKNFGTTLLNTILRMNMQTMFFYRLVTIYSASCFRTAHRL